MVITPSGIPYEEITPDMVPVIDLATGEWTEGKCKPSTEAPMHRLIFLNKVKMEAVVHTHSPFATAMSILVEELPAVAAASAPYSPVKVAPFEIPGSQEIAEAAVKAMGDHNVVFTGKSRSDRCGKKCLPGDEHCRICRGKFTDSILHLCGRKNEAFTGIGL